jgi:hypothetical protein
MKKILKKHCGEDKNLHKFEAIYNLLIHRMNGIDRKISSCMVLEKNSWRLLEGEFLGFCGQVKENQNVLQCGMQ